MTTHPPYLIKLERLLESEPSAIPLSPIYRRAAQLVDQNDLINARVAAKECLAACVNTLGDAHSLSFLSRFLCFTISAKLGDADEADLLFIQLVNALIFSITLNLPNGDANAAELFDQLLSATLTDSSLKSVLPRFDQDNDNLKSICELGIILMQNAPKQARCLLKAVLDVRTATKGIEHEETLLAAHNFGTTLMTLGEFQLAKPLIEQTFRLRLGSNGFANLLTLRSAGAYAGVLFKTGDKAAALLLQQNVFLTSMAINGETHPQTRIAENNLAKMEKGG